MNEIQSDKAYNDAKAKRISEITERFNENIKEVNEPYKSLSLKNKDKTIAIAELVYRPGSDQMAPNWLFTLIETILERS